MNRQELVDAILELTREPAAQTVAFSTMLTQLDVVQLGRLFDACADYDDVRNRAGRGRRSAQ